MEDKTRTNVIVNLVRTVVLTILSFITFPWVCRYLGSSAVGVYTWANTFVMYFLILAKIGIPNLAIRECVKVRDNKELLSNKVQTFFIIQLIMTVISFGLMTTLVFSVPDFRSSSEIIFLLSLNFITGAFSFEWLFIALEKQFYMCIRSIVVLTLSAILIIVFVTNPSDLYIYALITTSVTLLTTIANLVYSSKFISLKKTLPYSFKILIKPLIIIGSIALVIALYNQTDTLILGFIDPSKQSVADYSVGVKGIDVIIGIITALSTVFIPRATICYAQEDKKYFNKLNAYSVNICLMIVLPAIATMIALAVPITSLISGNFDLAEGVGYSDSPYILMILCSMMFTYSISDMIYGQILLPQKKEKFYLFSLLGGTILNVVFSIVLGKYVFTTHPAIGVAIGTAITDLFILVFLISVSWKWIKKALFNSNSLKILISTLIILGLTFLIKDPLYNGLYSINHSKPFAMGIQLVGVVIIDAFIYVGILLLLKEDLVMSIFRKNYVKSSGNPNLNENNFKRSFATTFRGLVKAISKKKYIEWQYKYITHHKLNFNNPIRYTEKLQYLRYYVYPNMDEVSRCAGRVGVREFLKENGLENLLIEVYGIYDSFEEIDFNELPNQFVMKCSHGCAMNYICYDKNSINKDELAKKFKVWLNTNYGKQTVELHYSKIKPQIIIEKLMLEDKHLPYEYKIHCFNGVAKSLYVVTARNIDIRYNNYYIDWTPFDGSQFNGWKKTDTPLEKPDNFDKMVEIAEKLSKNFPFVRVDLYNINGKIYFGEMTFTPAKGTLILDDDKCDFEMGEWLDISKYINTKKYKE